MSEGIVKQDPAAELAAADALLDAKSQQKSGNKPKPKSRAKKQQRVMSRGRAYVRATYNNTVVTMTDPQGNTLSWSSAGTCGFKGPKKATPYAASIVVRDLMRKLENVGLKEVEVFVRGVGSGRESAVRAMHANGLHVMSVKDVTPIPHNGCRPPKPRRI
ncbi:MAG: 30S ribosomal protein S11 [Candidatus Uhrbacteria bacterium]